jgi:hypothetical protein
LDGHSSHKSLEAVDFCEKNGIILLCLPPHTTHRLQPLDVSYFRSFKRYYDNALENFIRNHHGHLVTIRDIPSLVIEAFIKSAMPITAINGFRKTGIWPYNDEVFHEDEFMKYSAEISALSHEIISPESLAPPPPTFPLSKSSAKVLTQDQFFTSRKGENLMKKSKDAENRRQHNSPQTKSGTHRPPVDLKASHGWSQIPLSSKNRLQLAKRIGFHVEKCVTFGRISLHEAPRRLHHTKGDGNCFFRAISFVLSGK